MRSGYNWRGISLIYLATSETTTLSTNYRVLGPQEKPHGARQLVVCDQHRGPSGGPGGGEAAHPWCPRMLQSE